MSASRVSHPGFLAAWWDADTVRARGELDERTDEPDVSDADPEASAASEASEAESTSDDGADAASAAAASGAAINEAAAGINEAAGAAGRGGRAQAAQRDIQVAAVSGLVRGDALAVVGVDLKEHWTSGGGRFSEASLVKRLEELGIGRPSTYAHIIKVLDTRCDALLRAQGRVHFTL